MDYYPRRGSRCCHRQAHCRRSRYLGDGATNQVSRSRSSQSDHYIRPNRRAGSRDPQGNVSGRRRPVRHRCSRRHFERPLRGGRLRARRHFHFRHRQASVSQVPILRAVPFDYFASRTSTPMTATLIMRSERLQLSRWLLRRLRPQMGCADLVRPADADEA